MLRFATTPTVFTERWVDNLVEQSAGLTRHAVLRGAVSFPAFVIDAIEGMFSRFSPDRSPVIRAYVDNGQRFGLTERFLQPPQTYPDGLSHYLGNCVGADLYCVTLNGLTRWSEAFTRLVQAELVQPLTALTGRPTAGCDFYAFIGNYGFTPFGAHDDDDHSLVFHLGPGLKTVYVWPRDQYRGLAGHELTTVDFQRLLPHAQRYDLSPGDLVFIPEGDFHVFDTPEFSFSLGFTIFHLSIADDLRTALSEYYPSDDARAIYFEGERPDGKPQRHPDMLNLAEMVVARRAALASNGHVTTTPYLPTRDQTGLPPDTVFHTDPWHPVIACPLSPGYALFVRGRVIRLATDTGLETFSHFLATSAPFTREKLVLAMADYWTEDATDAVLHSVHALGGVSVASEQAT